MRHTYILKTAVAGLLIAGLASCADDLNISSIDPQSSQSYDDMELLAKQYATLGVTGQAGPNGKGDISGDEGETAFYRVVFNLQELGSDELIWAWQTDPDIPQITNLRWTSSSLRAGWAWKRLAYDITNYNSYLEQMKGRTDGEYPHYLAEVRFLRALHYWYYLDLFHKAPFKDALEEGFSMSALPVEKAGKDLYDWLDAELTAIEPMLAEIGAFNNASNFGRADRGAAMMLHARLALNSVIYTDGQVNDYQKAVSYCDQIINSGKYALSTTTNDNGYTGYEQVFMGDNDVNQQAMKECIFPIRQDGKSTEEHGGSTYLVSSARALGMPYMSTNNAWTCNFAREALVKKFIADPEKDCPIATADEIKNYVENGHPYLFKNEKGELRTPSEMEVIAADNELGGATKDIIKVAGDDRAMFYAGIGGCTVEESRIFRAGKNITGFLNGLSIVKWQNRRSDNSKHSDDTFSDTDIPVFRLAEAYLTRAEAKYRLGQNEAALSDLNVLRSRAHTTAFTSIDEDILIDEWCREFYMEGRRRSDLVRFGRFTTKKYIWDWKGGSPNGQAVDARFNIYPVPANELSTNKNLTQNPGY